MGDPGAESGPRSSWRLALSEHFAASSSVRGRSRAGDLPGDICPAVGRASAIAHIRGNIDEGRREPAHITQDMRSNLADDLYEIRQSVLPEAEQEVRLCRWWFSNRYRPYWSFGAGWWRGGEGVGSGVAAVARRWRGASRKWGQPIVCIADVSGGRSRFSRLTRVSLGIGVRLSSTVLASGWAVSPGGALRTVPADVHRDSYRDIG